MQSDWRGEKRITSIPKREISYREAADAISSMAQQASPMGMGQTECFLIQLITESARVTITSPSTLLL